MLRIAERQRKHCRFVGRPGGEKREHDERYSRPLRPSTHNQCYRAEHLYRGGQNSPNFRVRKAFNSSDAENLRKLNSFSNPGGRNIDAINSLAKRRAKSSFAETRLVLTRGCLGPRAPETPFRLLHPARTCRGGGARGGYLSVRLGTPRALDPACGGGSFLGPMLRALVARECEAGRSAQEACHDVLAGLRGIEIDPGLADSRAFCSASACGQTMTMSNLEPAWSSRGTP